ncbi:MULTISPECIES: PD-(D/E)XK nuclease family protein [unclassified Lysinibacillus]|uniref:PD-(D/E)XK nuclease family protein n=1 Tax=unclassified Lysinibacillus TaxID=2636778 RepID=UPI002011BF59|nr:MULTISPECIES: PD-(D/E)XK nuclease family protein [unclassified Lysinibacillus]MCL1695809.1 PD-(D/E)XK nuclease family protein [Lysinibacillus sp. BPa_S21]MCL1699946.1 PD-(D/E)XK nuclease family protein [Lysinibacillus sp. Bpr_S20]
MSNNFVNIVGYQLEKVHTGVISWILDTENKTVSLQIKFEIIRRIYKMCNKAIDFQLNEIKNINCFPEYSFGRKRKIDLVIKIDLFNSTPRYLVIEMKVDSIPTSDQLQGTQFDFNQKNVSDQNNVLFLLFLFGSAQVCEQPELYNFNLFRLPWILEVFAGFPIEEYIYKDWIASLENENLRKIHIKSELENAPEIWDDSYWKKKRYRTWFPLFYYIYHELKCHSKRFEEWDIYSGQNNPVMNWRNGCLHKDILGHPIKFYWEFNYEDFVLKAMIDEHNKLSHDDLNWLRDEVGTICHHETHYGRKTQYRYGTYNSLYKWEFDFKNQDITFIMKKVDEILDKIHPILTLL